MSARFPLIAIWDDHESSNDSWQTGAENHSPATEGPWEDRKQAAMRAYYEWMPIRDPKEGKARESLFRHLDFGDLLSLVTVETRLTARAEPLIIETYKDDIQDEAGADKFKRDILGDPSREMYGQVQEDFIVGALTSSKEKGKTWRVIANQVIMGRLLTPDLAPYVDETAVAAIEKDWPGVRDMVELSKYNFPVYPDSWDGYPVARNRFYKRLIENDVQDIFVLTGDAHEFWMNDLTSDDGEKVGVEVVSTAVSSETLVKYLGSGTADYALLLTQGNDDARYYNPLHNGYTDITFGRDAADVKMIAISNTQSREYSANEVASFSVKPNKGLRLPSCEYPGGPKIYPMRSRTVRPRCPASFKIWTSSAKAIFTGLKVSMGFTTPYWQGSSLRSSTNVPNIRSQIIRIPPKLASR